MLEKGEDGVGGAPSPGVAVGLQPSPRQLIIRVSREVGGEEGRVVQGGGKTFPGQPQPMLKRGYNVVVESEILIGVVPFTW